MPRATRLLVCELERIQEENIERNKRLLESLGVDNARKSLPKKQKPTPRPREKSISDSPPRRSSRIQKLPPQTSSPYVVQDFNELEKEEKVQTDMDLVEKGYKLKGAKGALRWRGECYGHVEGVEVGTEFGVGDWQRKGREEMSNTGFHVPFVQPEYMELNGGTYAVVLNNDNGSSRDKGDVVYYAGSGGRHRGQNRTAKQSFHQTWTSAVNASLKISCQKRHPLRVIRGPKLDSAYKPKDGGYRYDGLYMVEEAYMEPNKDGLNVCMFKLVRQPGQKPLIKIQKKASPAA